jgi:hypothetical protein
MKHPSWNRCLSCRTSGGSTLRFFQSEGYPLSRITILQVIGPRLRIIYPLSRVDDYSSACCPGSWGLCSKISRSSPRLRSWSSLFRSFPPRLPPGIRAGDSRLRRPNEGGGGGIRPATVF